MSLAISALTFVAARIVALFELTRRDRIAAMKGLSPAVAATISYTTRREQGHERNLDEEKRLHDLWFQASTEVSPYNKDLAKVCKEKSQYWLQFDKYKEQDVIDIGFELRKIEATLESMKH